MRIGDMARAAGLGVDTIRYYERQGLLPAPPRSESNYRRYGPEHLQRLRLIRHARGLGLSLDEVRELLQALNPPQPGAAHVDALLDAHLGHVRARIRELQGLEQALMALRGQCQGGEPDCGSLRSLLQAAAEGDVAALPVVDGLHP